jgi:integrase
VPCRHVCVWPASARPRREISAIDRANQVLRIVGKGNKERLAPLPQPVLDALGHLWQTHRNPRWLFPNRHGDAPVNKRVLSDTFAAAAAAAGIQRGVTPHCLSAAAASVPKTARDSRGVAAKRVRDDPRMSNTVETSKRLSAVPIADEGLD